MVTKSKKTAAKKSRAKVGRLNVNKETVKRLAAEDLRRVRGGHPSNTKACNSK
jgi:nucleoside-triphosphatase THEP1